MNTADSSSIDDLESAVLVPVTELQRQLNESLNQLSPCQTMQHQAKWQRTLASWNYS